MGPTVLVLDDDDYMRELVSLHLSAAGYEVLVAEDAVVAGHLVLSRKVDLLLTDIELPYMDGLEFVRALKSDPAVASIPVVFVTSQDEYEGRGMALGAAAFLRKPVHADLLLATVARHVQHPLKICEA